MRQLSTEKIDDEGALRLAEAIVGGICEDYRDLLRARLLCIKKQKELDCEIAATEALIRSNYFGRLSMGAIEPEETIRLLRMQVNEEEGC